jgi:hypothetical protein
MAKSPRPNDQVSERTAGAQGVELKVTVAEQMERAAADAFDLAPGRGERRRIFFFDTPGLTLFNGGLVLRARQVKGGEDDSTVKIRPVDPRSIGDRWTRLRGFKIEADGVGSRMIRSASLSVEQREGEIKAVEQQVRPIRKLFSDEQEALVADTSRTPVDFDALKVLGPIDALRWKVEHDGLPYPISAEEWTLPDGRDLLEVSIKVPTAQAAAASAAFDRFLKELHLQPKGGQQTKTRVALQFFVKLARV